MAQLPSRIAVIALIAPAAVKAKDRLPLCTEWVPTLFLSMPACIHALKVPCISFLGKSLLLYVVKTTMWTPIATNRQI